MRLLYKNFLFAFLFIFGFLGLVSLFPNVTLAVVPDCITPTEMWVYNRLLNDDDPVLHVRVEPVAGSTEVTQIPDEGQFEVCSNPAAGSGNKWHVVKYRGKVGWANTDSRWASPVTPPAAGGTVGASSIFTVDPASTKYGLDTTAGVARLPKIGDLPTIIGNVLGTALSLISVVFFGLMIYGGFMWMTARGNDEQAKKALETIFSAIIGIIIVMAAYAITSFVFSSMKSPGGSAGSTPATPTAPTYDSQEGFCSPHPDAIGACINFVEEEACSGAEGSFTCNWAGTDGGGCISNAISDCPHASRENCTEANGCSWSE